MIELNHKVVPVATLKNLEDTEKTLSLLKEGGLKVIEITFRTEYAKSAIAYGVKNYPDILIGAGTVINAAQCEDAIEAGAKFIVGPGFSSEVAEICKKRDILYLPGVVTPTEVMMAVNAGITTVKFFPFSTFGGLDTVNALAGPFPNVKFMITNGITADNCEEYLKNPYVVAVGGSWMLKGSEEEKLEKIKRAAEIK
jgi:2-dehydro-3-deoxyphosphogluconate aldolase/(4S)-4-hydroxy-2-oxoglutarate aldolase